MLQFIWLDVLLVLALAAVIFLLAVRYIRHRRAQKTGASLAFNVFEGAVKPLIVLIVTESLILVLGSLPYFESWREQFSKAAIIILILLFSYGLTRVGVIMISWSLQRRGTRRKMTADPAVVRFLQRALIFIVYGIGLLILLDYLHIPITPLVASLGVGGLAVALALQPLLGNFFAGMQIISDQVMRVGDFIEVEGGVAGYVVDIGWRSSRIRTPYNQFVIVPNSKLAESSITNYYTSMPKAVLVYCGVSYSSDLEQVEKVAIAVANEIIRDLDEALKTSEPWFGYEEFGESNIVFWLWLDAKDRLATFRLKSELIKRLHKRFTQEKITINYPVRTTYLQWLPGTQPQPPRRRGRGDSLPPPDAESQ